MSAKAPAPWELGQRRAGAHIAPTSLPAILCLSVCLSKRRSSRSSSAPFSSKVKTFSLSSFHGRVVSSRREGRAAERLGGEPQSASGPSWWPVAGRPPEALPCLSGTWLLLQLTWAPSEGLCLLAPPPPPCAWGRTEPWALLGHTPLGRWQSDAPKAVRGRSPAGQAGSIDGHLSLWDQKEAGRHGCRR